MRSPALKVTQASPEHSSFSTDRERKLRFDPLRHLHRGPQLGHCVRLAGNLQLISTAGAPVDHARADRGRICELSIGLVGGRPGDRLRAASAAACLSVRDVRYGARRRQGRGRRAQAAFSRAPAAAAPAICGTAPVICGPDAMQLLESARNDRLIQMNFLGIVKTLCPTASRRSRSWPARSRSL